MKLSFIVSAWAKPNALRTCLSSLVQQTMGDFEIIVMDNATDNETQYAHHELCRMDPRIMYWPSWASDRTKISCYYSSEFAAVSIAKGEWLCFPSDDSYYVPTFAEKMVSAGDEPDASIDIPCGDYNSDAPLDLVCCDFVWGRHNHWSYCDGGPQVAHIDKTTFIVRREWFNRIGWPGKHAQGGDSCSDGLLAERMVQDGARIGRVVEILCVHN